MRSNVLCLAILATFLPLACLEKTALGGDETLRSVRQRAATNYRTIVNQAGLLTMLYMGPEREWLVTVVRQSQRDRLWTYRMSFYHQQTKQRVFEKLFEYETIDTFQTAYSSIERDRLFTIWTTGSAHRLKVFWVKGATFTEVLSAGWKGEPEFAHLANDIELEILVPVEDVSQKRAKFADIYQWTGKGYVLVHRLPWEDRFRAMRGSEQTPK